MLVEKAVARGWRVVIQTTDEARQKAIDDLLWTYAAESFLPHGLARDVDAARQPILVATDAANPNAAAMRMYVEGAEVDLDPASAAYERVILMFDGRNEVDLDAARRQWSRLKASGFSLAYWQQGEQGGWQKRM